MTSKMLNLSILLATCMLPFAEVQAADLGQNVAVSQNVQIPGGNLNPGTYKFSVEDRLADRAIVRISNAQDANEHYLILAVPNTTLKTTQGNRLLYFRAANEGKQSLRAWKCESCTAPLEFVYPKLEAVKITDDSTEPVMAVDPSYDKLPSNLSADDMKVVTLWLLSPERITAGNVGQGVKAAKYLPEANQVPANQVPQDRAAAQTPALAERSVAAPVQMASAASSPPAANLMRGRSRLPKTASNSYLFGVYGLVCLAGAFLLRMTRQRSSLIAK